MTTVVIDNTVLSNFAHILQPLLLAAAFDQPVTVGTVMSELTSIGGARVAPPGVETPGCSK